MNKNGRQTRAIPLPRQENQVHCLELLQIQTQRRMYSRTRSGQYAQRAINRMQTKVG